MFTQKMITVVVTAIVLHLACAIGFMWCGNRSAENHSEGIRKTKEQWGRDDANRRALQEEELQAKFGTTKLDRIAYDPRMDVALVLDKLFEEATPETYEIDVRVDRFNEFTVYVYTVKQPDKFTMAGYMRQVFMRVDPALVYQLIFSDEDDFVIVETAQWLKISNWETATSDDIVKACLR